MYKRFAMPLDSERLSSDCFVFVCLANVVAIIFKLSDCPNIVLLFIVLA